MSKIDNAFIRARTTLLDRRLDAHATEHAAIRRELDELKRVMGVLDKEDEEKDQLPWAVVTLDGLIHRVCNTQAELRAKCNEDLLIAEDDYVVKQLPANWVEIMESHGKRPEFELLRGQFSVLFWNE
jgi:hypothetical protein